MDPSPKFKILRLSLLIFTIFIIISGGLAVYSKKKNLHSNKTKISDLVRDETLLKKTLQGMTVKKVMTRLVDESEGGSAYDCHQEAHNIGRMGYEIYKEKAFGECNASCHSGCYHGAMEKFLNEQGTEKLAENIDRICKSFPTSFSVFECLHGVGHGVLAYVDYDLPEALKECQKLSDAFGRDSCYGGVFMENILTGQGLGASESDHDTKWVNREDPLYPCNAIDKDASVQHQCYLMQTSWMLTINNYDFDKVAAECLKAPDSLISVCFKSFGRDAAGHTLRNPQKIVEICNKVPKDSQGYHEECATGAVNVIVDFWGPALRNQAHELCRIIEEPGKRVCYTTLASRIKDVFGAPNVFTIEVDDKKFSPDKITIKKGQTITFVNRGKEGHWPASNIHPTHGIYPEFDPKEPIPASLSWSFTFDKTGQFRFHDHLFPKMKGMITVE
jgi:plastocyanin